MSDLSCVTDSQLALGLAIALVAQALFYYMLYGAAMAAYITAELAIFYFSIIIAIYAIKLVEGMIR